MARGQLPANAWLQARLTSNVNLNNTCNAFWNGSTLNFYRSGGGCANTGELAGVFDHEWGHGMDQNDATPGISGPLGEGEGIADVYTALRLNDSCIGRGFRPGFPCTDGTSGTYHSDESIDRIVVSTLDGRGFCEGATVRIDATVWPWASFSTDTADFYYAADANNPVWVYVGSVVPPAGGLQVLSQQYTLPAGSLQAVRVNFRYNGSVSTCGTGSYDDTDDLVFAVGECAVSCDACPGCVHQELEGFEAGNGGWAFNSVDCIPAQGQFVSGTPNLVVDAGVTTQPAGAQAGSYALYTQPNASPGVNDVDDTECIATSPVYNVAAKGSLSAWYFHGQRDEADDPGDHFCLEVSVNNGPWTGMASFGDVTTQANWTEALEPVTQGDTVRLRIRAADGTDAIDLVEAGIDNVSVCGETGLQGNE